MLGVEDFHPPIRFNLTARAEAATFIQTGQEQDLPVRQGGIRRIPAAFGHISGKRPLLGQWIKQVQERRPSRC